MLSVCPCVLSVSVRVVPGCGSGHVCGPCVCMRAVCMFGVSVGPYVGLCALDVLRVGVASPPALTLW